MNIAKGHDERVKKLVLAIGKASYPRCQLVADMGLKQGSRYIFRHNYLKPAYEMGLVEMVYGNVPTKPEQVYRLTPKGLALWEELTAPQPAKQERQNACPHNNVDCPCAKEGCPRHGKCCECVKHHREHGKKLPVCLRGIDWEQ